jgi:DNA-binding response OmpR family regulator
MNNILILAAQNNYIDNLVNDLKAINFETHIVYSLFELKKKAQTEQPAVIFVADNLKEKKIEIMLTSILESDALKTVPIIGITISEESLQSTKEFFENGVVDVIHLPVDILEVQLRLSLRIQESELRNYLTPNQYFFSEAQEKEQGKRTGYFRFYDSRKVQVGEVAIKGGKIVSATYGSLIKEDAFLQLACNSVLFFRFEDMETVPAGRIEVPITGMLLEASKFKDEIKKQEGLTGESIKALIIDNNRIARLLASRSLRESQIESKVIGADEFSLRLMTNFSPNFLIIDFKASELILDQIWQTGHSSDDMPVIIYCDEDVKNLNFSRIGKHSVEAVVSKDKFQKTIHSILNDIFDFTAVK